MKIAASLGHAFPAPGRDAHYYIGCAQLHAGERDAAGESFARAANLGHRLAPNNAGLHLLSKGDKEAALAQFARGANCGDHLAASHAAHVSMDLLGRTADGVAWLEVAVGLGSASAPAKLAKALLPAADGAGRPAVGRGRVQSLYDMAVERGYRDESVLKPVEEFLGL